MLLIIKLVRDCFHPNVVFFYEFFKRARCFVLAGPPSGGKAMSPTAGGGCRVGIRTFSKSSPLGAELLLEGVFGPFLEMVVPRLLRRQARLLL